MATTFTPAPFFLVRTPTLPWDHLREISIGDGVESNLNRLPKHHADVAERAMKHAQAEHFQDSRTKEQEQTLTRSLFRMASKASPFGLSAGCTLGYPGETTIVVLPEPQNGIVISGPNGGTLSAIAAAIKNQAKRHPQSILSLNPTIYSIGNDVRFVCRANGGYRWHRLKLDPAIAHLMNRGHGPSRWIETSLALSQALGIEVDEASAFIETLLSQDVLRLEPQMLPVSDLGSCALVEAALRLGLLQDESSSQILDDLAYHQTRCDSFIPAEHRDRVKVAAAQFGVRHDEQCDIHSMMWRNTDRAEISSQHIGQIASTIDALCALGMMVKESESDSFRERFVARFGYEAVPLLELVDPDHGLEDFSEVSPHESSHFSVGKLHPIHQYLLNRLNDEEVRIERSHVDELKSHFPVSLPDSFSALFEAWRGERETRFVLHGTGGPPGTALLARFAPWNPQFSKLVQDWCKIEDLALDYPTVEVYHVPFDGVRNVAVRPNFRNYNISVDGESYGLDLKDLSIVADNGMLHLVHSEVGVVVPRLTTAMNPNFGLRSCPVYRLFSLLQSQHLPGVVAWDWGPLGGARHLPRIVVHGVTVSPRRWLFGSKSFDNDLQSARDAGLPALVSVHDAKGPRVLSLDPSGVAELRRIVVKLGQCPVLEANPPGLEGLAVDRGGFRYLTEIVLPFIRSKSGATRTQPKARTPSRAPSLPPGDKFLTLKVYAGSDWLEQVSRSAPPIALRELAECSVSKWHYLKYADPDWHVRLRFQGDFRHVTLGQIGRMIDRIKEQLNVSSVEIASFRPEVNRYGGYSVMPLVQDVFFRDSVASVVALSLPSVWADSNLRLSLALIATRLLVQGLVSGDEARSELCRYCLEHYSGGDGSGARREASRALRGWASQAQLRRVSYLWENDVVRRLLDARDSSVRAFSDALAATADSDSILLSRGSVVHLQCNRYLRAGDRESELLIYEILRRVFHSF